MSEELTVGELEMIQESLKHTIRAFRDYAYYPSYEFKCKQIAEAQALSRKVTVLKKRIKAEKAQ